MEPSTPWLNPQFPFSYLACPLPSLLRSLKGSSYKRKPQGGHPEDGEHTEPAPHRTLRSPGNLQAAVLWLCLVLALKAAKVLLLKVILHWGKHLESAAASLLVRCWGASAVREKILSFRRLVSVLWISAVLPKGIYSLHKGNIPFHLCLLFIEPKQNQNFVLKIYHIHFCEEHNPLATF